MEPTQKRRDLAIMIAATLVRNFDIGEHYGPGGSNFDRASTDEVQAVIQAVMGENQDLLS